MVGGMLCKSDKPPIIIIIYLDLDTWIVPGQNRKANLCLLYIFIITTFKVSR